MTIYNAEIITANNFSLGFPHEKIKNKIPRDNYIVQIESLLIDNNILFIDGEEDSGKTTLLVDFLKKHQQNSVSIFFRPLNKIDYEIDYFFENANDQLDFLLNDKKSDKDVQSSILNFRSLLHRLRKKYKNRDKKFYFIIDGLENNTDESIELLSQIIDLIPLAEDFIRLIITGSPKKIKSKIGTLVKCDIETINVLGFNMDESSKFTGITDQHIVEQFFKVTKGFPGRLNTINRLLEKGISIEKISENDSYTNYVNLDCEEIDLKSKNSIALISVVTFSEKNFTIDELCTILDLEKSEISNILDSMPVLERNEKICFVSGTHKKFFTNRLRNTKNSTKELLIKYYTDSNTISSKYELFKIFSENNQWNKVEEIVDENFITSLIENTGSLQKVSDSIEKVFEASSNLKNYSSIFKYSLIGSIINELDSYTFWESEIIARLAINDYSGAINLAESAVLKVDRLRLLSLIARKQKESNKTVDENLSETINELYKTIDLSGTGNVIYDIVSNLIYALPSLAVEIIENSSSEKKAGNINNWIIAKLSFAAINSLDEEGDKKIDAINKLNNPETEKINRAIAFMIGNYSCEKVIIEVKKIEDPNEKIRFLRLWLSNNKFDINDEDKVKIINFSIDQIIKSSTENTVSFEILKDFNAQLPTIRNYDAKSKILDRFKALEPNIQDIGQTKDKFIYQLNMFQTQYKLSTDKGIHFINQIIKNVESIDDLLIKFESYSEIYHKLTIYSTPEIKKKKTFVYHQIQQLADELLSQSANHYQSLLNIVETISSSDPVLSLDIIRKVNTIISRDRLRIHLLESYLKNNVSKINFSTLKTIQIEIESPNFKEIMVRLVLERLNDSKSLPNDVITNLLFFSDQIPKFSISPSDKLNCYILVLKIISKNDFWFKKLAEGIKKKIDHEFNKIGREWEKIDYAYKLCAELVTVDRNYAKEKFNEGEKIKENTWLDSGSIAQVYINTLSLTIKCFEGILLNKENFDKEYRILEQLITDLPSEFDRIILWTQLAVTAYVHNRIEFSKKIYDKYIFQQFNTPENKSFIHEDSLETMILVRIFNPDLANELIRKMSYFSRENCCNIIVDFYLSKKNPFNYYEGDIFNNKIELQDIYNTISVMELCEMDNNIYTMIDKICKSEIIKDLTKIQIADIVDKLTKIIDQKLPDQRNIKHDGYKIIAKIKVKLLNKNERNYDDLFNSAQALQNVSDRLFVNYTLLESIPFSKFNLISKKGLFDKIVIDLNSLPNNYEFVDRVSQISETMFKCERMEWKKIIDKAFVFSKEIEEGSEAYNFQRKMIDSIYRVDEDVAKDLINSIDKENNDFKQRRLLKKYYDTLEISNKIRNNKTIQEKEKEDTRIIISGLRRALGSINSGKVSIKKIDDIVKYLDIGYKTPLLECLSLFSFYFANCARTQVPKNSTSEISKINDTNFYEIVQSLNLIQFLSRKRKLDIENNRKNFIESNFKSNFIAKPGTRAEALSYLRDWALDQAEEYLIIADPYFCESDLELIKYFKQVNENLTIQILTNNGSTDKEIQQKFLDFWKKISDEEAPITKITICWVPDDNNNTPFHDRCIITKGSGLRIGTSIKSLGNKKDSEISLMKNDEINTLLEESLNGFLSGNNHFAGSQRIKYQSFSL